MHFDDPFRNGQTQPRSAVLARAGFVRPPEAVKYVERIFLRDPNSRIRYGNGGEPIPRFTVDRYLAASGRILRRIVNKDQKRPPERHSVRLNPNRALGRFRRKVQTAITNELLALVRRVTHDSANIHRGRFDSLFARVRTGEQHKAIDGL